MAATLVLADPHPVFLLGLEQLLAAEPAFRVVERCGTAAEARQAVRRHRPDLLLLDIRLPDRDGLQLLGELNGDGLPTRSVILTAALNDEQVLEALRLGVQGVVLKEMPPHLLLQCLHKVHAGEQWLEKKSVGHFLETVLRRESGARQLAAVLTAREIEIVRLVAGGLSNRQIAGRLFVSEGTIKVHLHHIYRKLGVDSRVELTLLAQKRGLA
jgi:DNA-binding NarL/FixJ family response regulator